MSNVPADRRLGSGIVVSEYSEGLRRLGHEVTLVEPEQYEPFCKVTALGRRYRQAVGMAWSTVFTQQNSHFDLVEFYGGEAWLATTLLAHFPRHRRPLIIQHTNGPEPRYSRLQGSKRWFQSNQGRVMRGAFSHADAVVTVSEDDRRWLISEQLVAKERVLAINNGVTQEFRRPGYIERAQHRVGFAGSWIPRRGVDIARGAIIRALRFRQDIQAIIIGPGPEFCLEKEFPADVRHRIEVVPFLCDKNRLRAELERVSIYLWPSYGESFGIILAEAMASGCAAVASPVGYGATLRHLKDCFILETPTEDALFEAIRFLVENSGTRREVARSGQATAQSLDWVNSVECLDIAYRRWVREHTGRASVRAS
jgi:glycosyltransferase involved in cell wall biosynthesis